MHFILCLYHCFICTSCGLGRHDAVKQKAELMTVFKGQRSHTIHALHSEYYTYAIAFAIFSKYFVVLNVWPVCLWHLENIISKREMKSHEKSIIDQNDTIKEMAIRLLMSSKSQCKYMSQANTSECLYFESVFNHNSFVLTEYGGCIGSVCSPVTKNKTQINYSTTKS